MRMEKVISAFEEIGKTLSASSPAHSIRFSKQTWLEAAKHGLHGLMIPKDLGGLGLSGAETVAALYGFGKGNNNTGLGFGLGAQLLSCAVPLLKHELKGSETLLEQMASGQLVVAHGMSEPASGSDAFAMQSRATEKESGEYVLRGTKHFTTNIHEAHAVIFFAMTQPELGYFGGSSCFFVPCDQLGFNKGVVYSKAGLHGCSLGEFHLENVTVPTENRIGDAGLGSSIFATSMLWERLGLTALHLGWCAQLHEALIGHFKQERRNFPKKDHQNFKHQFVRLSGLNEAFLSQLLHLAHQLDEPKKDTTVQVSRLKVLVSEHLQQFACLGIEIISTFNHTNHWIEQLFLDAAATKIYSGSTEVQLNLSAGNYRI